MNHVAVIGVALVACTPSAVKEPTVLTGVAKEPSFVVTVLDKQPVLAAGTVGTVGVQIVRIDGDDDRVGDITFDLVNAPSGISASGLIGRSELTTNVTVRTGDSTERAQHLLTLRARGQTIAGPIDRTDTFYLTVMDEATPDFSLAIAPSPLSMQPGGNSDATVILTRSAALSGPIALSVQNLPAGITADLAQTSTEATAAGLAISVGSAMPDGNYTVSVAGTAAGVVRHADLAITVGTPVPSVVAPSALTYASPVSSYALGVAISPNTVLSVQGSPVDSYSATLPPGLSIHPTTGAISGTPTTPSSANAYTVTATNTGGQTTASLSIAVIETCPTSTHQCTPAVPAGWTGPVAISSGSTAAACPGEFPTQALLATSGLNVPNPVCTCACGSLSSWECTSAGMQARAGAGGPPGCGTVYQSGDQKGISMGGCTTYTKALDADEVTNPLNQIYTAPPYCYGSCTSSSPGQNPKPPVTWDEQVRACGGSFSQLDCSAGQLCAPKPPSGFNVAACIVRSGSLSCPGAWPNDRTVWYTGTNDTRTCSGCSCNANLQISSTLTVYSSGNCSSGVLATVPLTGTYLNSTCVGANIDTIGSASFSTPTLQSSSCGVAAGSAQGSGTATETGPFTVCCQ